MQAPRQGDIAVYNYCVSFIDLLGQKEAFHGQGLLPRFKSDEERTDFLQAIRKTIGAVVSLQEDANRILAGLNEVKGKPVNGVPQLVQDEMRKENVTKQHWSDGLSPTAKQLNSHQLRSGKKGVQATLTDHVLRHVPIEWLRSQYRLIDTRLPGEFFHPIDNISEKGVTASSCALALAVLFDSADEALNFWFSRINVGMSLQKLALPMEGAVGVVSGH